MFGEAARRAEAPRGGRRIRQNKNNMAERGPGRGPVSCWAQAEKSSVTRTMMKRERRRAEGSRNNPIKGFLAVNSAAKFTSVAVVVNKNKTFHTLPWRREYPSLRPPPKASI